MTNDAEAGARAGTRAGIRVGLARTETGYGAVRPPYPPAERYPELAPLLGDDAPTGPANPAFAGVRAALHGLGLDAARYGSREWNPLGALVPRGGRIALKPNFIRHWNPCEGATLDCVITHGAVLRAVADYAFLAVGPEGSVVLAEAPQHDCDWDRIRDHVGLDPLAAHYAERGRTLELVDLRRETVVYRDGVIVERKPLPGDPRGYRVVDLGRQSFFEGSGLDPGRFRGADYDPGPTAIHHMHGRNEYLLSETVLQADLVVNLPKLKTHKKTGVTLALKNLVGINGDKNWLPHHCAGSGTEGGDEFPGESPLDRARSRATEWARGLLARGRGVRFLRFARRLEDATRGSDFIRSGNWHGNRTTWRMCADLNRCLYYSDAEGLRLDAAEPVRTVLTVLDGIVAGEGEGPLAPRDVPMGVVLAGTDPIAVDLAAVRLMGYEEQSLPKIREAMADPGPRITRVARPADVRVFEVETGTGSAIERSLDEIRAVRTFEAHPGWKGHVERKAG